MKKADRIILVRRICRIASLSNSKGIGHYFTKKQLHELHLHLIEMQDRVKLLENKVIGGPSHGEKTE